GEDPLQGRRARRRVGVQARGRVLRIVSRPGGRAGGREEGGRGAACPWGCGLHRVPGRGGPVAHRVLRGRRPAGRRRDGL
ncbi:MAG: hypothetical protein AVDCRST_MAG08-2610, partial [uncultured Acetobacteraceae bacterium]